jgi:tetratricopeptide (TPR) repeat protein
MPGRPRQHELETESRRAFEAVLPASWVARPQIDDYGVDYHVEVFRDQQATGLLFAVQLKAVERLRGMPSARVRWRTYHYWDALDMPVLVVLWEAQSRRMWWQWAHHFDPWDLDTTSEEFTFRFPPDHLWDREGTPDALVAEVVAWRTWQRGLSTPIELAVSIAPAGVGDVPSGRLHAALRRRLANVSQVVELRNDPRNPVHLSMRVTGDTTAIWIAGGPSNTLHHEGVQWAGDSEPGFVAMWTADVLMLVAKHLSRIGSLIPAAARVAAAAVQDASVVNHPPVAAETVSLLVDGNRVDDAVRLIGRLTHSDMTEASVGAMAGMLEASGRLAQDDKERVVGTFLGWADINEHAGKLDQAGQFAYWAARFVGADNPSRAVQLFELAAEKEPGYRQRDYWHREVGGMLFLASRYQEAAEAYRRANDLGNAEAWPLLADALMLWGRYREALEQFQGVIQNDELTRPEWRLKHHVLDFLIRTLSLSEQARRIEDAGLLASDPALDRSRLFEVLQMDALCGEALYRLGNLAHEAGERSVDWFLASAAAEPTAAIAWLQAMERTSSERPEMFQDIALCARRFSGDEIIQLLLQADETGTAAEEMISLFEALPPEPPERLEVRLTTPGSSEYRAIRVGEDLPLDHGDETPPTRGSK